MPPEDTVANDAAGREHGSAPMQRSPVGGSPSWSNEVGGLRSSPLIWGALLVVLSALAYFPFVYTLSFGEWDSYRVAAGVLDAVREDARVGESQIRNNSVSYAYSYLLLAFRDTVRDDPAALYAVMNYVNAVAATLATLPFFIVMRRYFGLLAATGATIVLMAVPVWWNLALYAHPMMPAVLFFLCALAAVGYREQFVRSGRRMAFAVDAVVVALLALTLMFRLDAVLLFPMLTACVRLEGRSWTASFAVSIAWAVLALTLFIIVRKLIFPGGGELGGVLTSLGYWHDPARIFENFVRGVTIFVLAAHPLFLALYGVGVVLLLLRRAWSALFFLLPTLVLNVLFWLPNPSPSRHFMYVAPVLAAGVGVTLAMLFRRGPDTATSRVPIVAASAAGLALASLLVAEAYFPLLQRAYPWKYGVQDYSARAPIRSIVANKTRTEAYFRRAGAIGEHLAALPAAGQPYLVIVDPRPVQVELLMHAPNSSFHMRPAEQLGPGIEFPVVTTDKNQFHLLDIEDDVPLRLLEIEGDFSDYVVAVDDGNPAVAHAVSRYGDRARAALGLRPLHASAEQ